jgi:hypothetical protein
MYGALQNPTKAPKMHHVEHHLPYNFALISFAFASSYAASMCSRNAFAVCGRFNLSLFYVSLPIVVTSR